MKVQEISIPGEALIDIDRAAEFTGDDVDQYSSLVDLGYVFENVQVYIPTITSATISLALQRDGDIDTVPLPFYDWLDIDADTDVLASTKAETTTKVVIFRGVNARFLRIKAGSNQAADRTFYVIGC